MLDALPASVSRAMVFGPIARPTRLLSGPSTAILAGRDPATEPYNTGCPTVRARTFLPFLAPAPFFFAVAVFAVFLAALLLPLELSSLYPINVPAKRATITPSAIVPSMKRGERSSIALFKMRFRLPMNLS